MNEHYEFSQFYFYFHVVIYTFNTKTIKKNCLCFVSFRYKPKRKIGRVDKTFAVMLYQNKVCSLSSIHQW